MEPTKTSQKITTLFENLVSSDQQIVNAHLLVHSDKSQIHLNLAGGNPKTPPDDTIQVGQPVFMASVGKLFTAVMIAMLCERGDLAFDHRIADIVDTEMLGGLHVFKGKDYTDQIRLRHLLNHTSGLPDYFEDKPAWGKGFIQRILHEPDRNFQPREVITWSKENLKPKFPPGKGFHYSDTGYLLLGLVIEAVTSVPFHNLLSHWIFEPLDMKQAFLIGHSPPLKASPYPVAGVYFGDTNIVGYRSLSVDYAGGGITAPLEDLLKFMQALAQRRLLSEQTLRKMDDCARFSPGIDYGYGMMKIRPVPLLMPRRYSCWGNAGSTGAFLFYHPGLDVYLIGSLNQFRYHQKGIPFMLQVIDVLLEKG